MSRPGASLAVLVFAAAIARGDPLEKPRVQVLFDLAEENYSQAFTEAERDAIRRDVTSGLVRALTERIGFLTFQAESADDHLVVKLGKRADEPGAGGIKPVFFWIRVEGPAVHRESDELFWEFRSLEQSAQAPGTASRFSEEVVETFERQLRQHEADLVARVLGKVVLAEDAHPWVEKECWVLPFARSQLRVDNRTTFEIRARIVKDGVSSLADQIALDVGDVLVHPQVPEEFHHKILTEIEGEPQLANADSVDVREIYLTVYRRLSDHLLQPTPPSEVAESEEPEP